MLARSIPFLPPNATAPAELKFFKFFSQSNFPDSFANFIIFVDFVLFSKAHYEKWGAVENRKFKDWEEKEKQRKSDSEGMITVKIAKLATMHGSILRMLPTF